MVRVSENNSSQAFVPRIKLTWQTTKPKIFDSDEASITSDALTKTTKQLEHVAVKLGTFGAQMEKEEDFELLEKPLEEFQKSYIILVGTLTAMGGGRNAGKSLRKEIVDFGNAACDAYAGVEAVVIKKDLELVKTLAREVGNLLDVLKRWAKVPRQNHTAVKKRLIVKIRELRDAQRELSEEMENGGDGEEEEKEEMRSSSKTTEDKSDICGMKATIDVIDSIENLLKASIHAIKDDKVVTPAAQEAFLDTVGKITNCTDELSTGFQSFDDDFFDELGGIDEEDEEGGDEETDAADRAELAMVTEKLNALLNGEFKKFVEEIKVENWNESFGVLEEKMGKLKSALC